MKEEGSNESAGVRRDLPLNRDEIPDYLLGPLNGEHCPYCGGACQRPSSYVCISLFQNTCDKRRRLDREVRKRIAGTSGIQNQV